MLGINSLSDLQQAIFFGHVSPFDLVLQWVAGPRVNGAMKRSESNNKNDKVKILKTKMLGVILLISFTHNPHTLPNHFLNSASFASCVYSPSLLSITAFISDSPQLPWITGMPPYVHKNLPPVLSPLRYTCSKSMVI